MWQTQQTCRQTGIRDSDEVQTAELQTDTDTLWLDSIVGMLRWYGPMPVSGLMDGPAALLPIAALDLPVLLEHPAVIQAPLIEAESEQTICLRSNYERLLLRARRQRRRQPKSFPVAALPWFWAELFQYNCPQSSSVDLETTQPVSGRLQQSLESLFGFPLEARLWEAAILPLRIPGYQKQWLDALWQQHDLRIHAAPGSSRNQRIWLAFDTDAHLLMPVSEIAPPDTGSAPDALPAGLYSSLEIQQQWIIWTTQQSQHPAQPLTAQAPPDIWDLFARGWIEAYNWQTIRDGILRGFGTVRRPGSGSAPALRRSGWTRSQRSAQLWQWSQKGDHRGNSTELHWNRNDPGLTSTAPALRNPTAPKPERDQQPVAKQGSYIWSPDPIEEQAARRQIIQILLDRYGLLFRELLAQELHHIRWPDLIPELRLLELAGEIQAGWFIEGLPGLQFASSRAIEALYTDWNQDRIWYLNAKDPHSLCGRLAPEIRPDLPMRRMDNWMVYHGPVCVMDLRSNGKKISCRFDMDNPYLADYFGIFTLLVRQAPPGRPQNMHVRLINDQAVYRSPWRPVLESIGFQFDGRDLVLWDSVGA